MKKFMILACAMLIDALVSPAMASTSSQVVLSRVSTNATNGTVALWATGGWGSVITNSGCATVSVVGFDVTTDAGKAMWANAMLAFAQQKSVIAFTSDTNCVAVGGLAPQVTRLDMVN